jgi:hypothetical protein
MSICITCLFVNLAHMFWRRNQYFGVRSFLEYTIDISSNCLSQQINRCNFLVSCTTFGFAVPELVGTLMIWTGRWGKNTVSHTHAFPDLTREWMNSMHSISTGSHPLSLCCALLYLEKSLFWEILVDDGGHGGGCFDSFITNFSTSATDYICHTCVSYCAIVRIQKHPPPPPPNDNQ